jgi:hypothetical protein
VLHQVDHYTKSTNRCHTPVTLGVIITGLVGAYKAYTDYKAAVAKTGEKEATPAKSAEAAKGEQAAQVVETGIQQYGKPEEQTALAGYQQSPQLFEPVLSKVLTDIAAREPAFAGQLLTMAQQANIQTGGVQGSVNVSGEGKVDLAAGVNTGTMTYHARSDKDE